MSGRMHRNQGGQAGAGLGHMPFSVGKTVVNIVYVVVLAIIIVAGTAMLVPRYRNYRFLSRQRAELEMSNLEQQRKLEETQRMQTRFREDPEFVERIARQNRRVRPGEVAFIFDSPDE